MKKEQTTSPKVDVYVNHCKINTIHPISQTKFRPLKKTPHMCFSMHIILIFNMLGVNLLPPNACFSDAAFGRTCGVKTTTSGKKHPGGDSGIISGASCVLVFRETSSLYSWCLNHPFESTYSSRREIFTKIWGEHQTNDIF